MNEFTINGKNYQVSHNGEYYVVTDEKGMAIIGVSNPENAKQHTMDFFKACEEYMEKVF